jgi:CheY-like chemotaxis protein
MISATDWSTIEAEAKAAGVDQFIPKPLFSSAIVDCVNRFFGAEGQPALRESPDEADDFGAYRIILAEDVDINREIVLALLEPTGLSIECAETGAEALRIYSENPGRFDLIFMDIHMPEMDGFEATRRIRAFEAELCSASKAMEFPSETSKQLLEHPSGVPIIAMTANVFREDIEKCLASGMNDHVGKPLNMEAVLEMLRIYLPRK